MKSGIQDLYEEPIEPDLTIDTSESVPEACVGELVSGLEAWKATEAMTLQLVRTAPGSRPWREGCRGLSEPVYGVHPPSGSRVGVSHPSTVAESLPPPRDSLQ